MDLIDGEIFIWGQYSQWHLEYGSPQWGTGEAPELRLRTKSPLAETVCRQILTAETIKT